MEQKPQSDFALIKQQPIFLALLAVIALSGLVFFPSEKNIIGDESSSAAVGVSVKDVPSATVTPPLINPNLTITQVRCDDPNSPLYKNILLNDSVKSNYVIPTSDGMWKSFVADMITHSGSSFDFNQTKNKIASLRFASVDLQRIFDARVTPLYKAQEEKYDEYKESFWVVNESKVVIAYSAGKALSECKLDLTSSAELFYDRTNDELSKFTDKVLDSNNKRGLWEKVSNDFQRGLKNFLFTYARNFSKDSAPRVNPTISNPNPAISL